MIREKSPGVQATGEDPGTLVSTAPRISRKEPSAFPARVVTAAALYDGHDAAINIVRRCLVAEGAEVIHLGHNRSVLEVAKAAIEEDAGAVAVSSYQGGHVEFFSYLREALDAEGGAHIGIYGGGGGVILQGEIEELEGKGISKIFSPEDGRLLGLDGMARRIVAGAREAAQRVREGNGRAAPARSLLARSITAMELGLEARIPTRAGGVTVLGVTGTGGAGKSSVVDELVLRLTVSHPELRIGIIAVDPTKRKTGGALLGDRIRMNAVYVPAVFLRSLATRGSGSELAPSVEAAAALLSRAGHGLIIVETAGIGQGSSGVLDVADLTLYVMTADFGGPTQLEKIDMLDFADFIAVNKSDRRGSEDAARLVRKQVSRGKREKTAEVFATTASRFNDPGVNALYQSLAARLGLAPRIAAKSPATDASPRPSAARSLPPRREQYLSEIADTIRTYRARTRSAAESLWRLEALEEAARAAPGGSDASTEIERLREAARGGLEEPLRELDEHDARREAYSREALTYRVRDRDLATELRRRTLSGTSLPRVAMPSYFSRADTYRYLREENLPVSFPFTAGVFPFKREDELPTRQFAGEGTPERTNRRYHLLGDGLAAKRLSVAFDSVTLYGADPHERPDIYGKIGTSGVSIATLDDMRKLFRGFDLLDPSTSVSMTINGPAPILLAMFFNAAIDQQADRFQKETGRRPGGEELERIRTHVLQNVRGTVQADILKEDQAQKTCILSTEFALKLMADVQEHFTREKVRNYYSISISGYHIAEAGANPVTQLAFTLANGFTYLELFRHRGLAIDDFVPNFSFFFSNGLDAEYAVLGRVARRIWAVVLRDLYGASERSQKLKYHIQTSGRSLHAREMGFNDIRTTIQALLAIFDNCNSLHTNAYDEAVTTPTEESVRKALAIQLIAQRELGLVQNENPLQGSFFMRELTDLVEDAVLAEFERISERGGVLGAMETGYIRNRIQEESLLYEELKHSGKLPIIGVNTFLDPNEKSTGERVPVVRSTEEEKRQQIANLREFQARHAAEAPAALSRLADAVLRDENVFAVLLETVRHASLGQIMDALFQVGGRYRRSL